VKIDRAGLSGLTCPVRSLCVAIDSADPLVISNNPGRGDGHCKLIEPSPRVALMRIACPTTCLCVAVDAAGEVVVSRDPRSAGQLGQLHARGHPGLRPPQCLRGASSVGPSASIAWSV
jgi:hypothetical protein